MTPAEADERIFLSRRTLRDYMSLAVVGIPTGPLDWTLIADEIVLLEKMAESHPSKAGKLAILVDEWTAFQDRVRSKLH